MILGITELLGESGFGSIYDPESLCAFVFSLLSVHLDKSGFTIFFN